MLKRLHDVIKPSYNPQTDNIPEEFYNRILKESNSYKRVSGYFSAKVLALYSQGLDELAENNGIVKFIISQDISEEDFDTIKEGYRKRENTEVLTEMDKIKLGNLAYLIALGKADIKFGLVKNGLFHSKWGLFEDGQGAIYFNGSMNETIRGLEDNCESFDVDFSWDISTNVRKRIKQKQEEFELLWNNKYAGVEVISANGLVYEMLKKYDVGKIRKPFVLAEDAFGLVLEEDNLRFLDKTKEKIIDKKSFRAKFSSYIDDSKGYPYFKSDIDYREVERIILRAKKQASKYNVLFLVSPEVEKMIINQRYSIEEYRKSGLTLKDKDSRWDEEFYEFKTIVENEVSRPLKPLQMDSAMYMLTQKRAANFSVPGAGKTAMLLGVYAFLNSSKNEKLIKRLLVVCPINAFKSWRDEFKAVYGDKKDLRVLSVHDNSVKGDINTFESQWSVSNLILVNYESLPKFQDSIIKCLTYDRTTMLVYDEVHRIKGVGAKRALAALEISTYADYRYVLTGTPIPNSYLDVYNFLHILFKSEYEAFFGFDKNLLKNPSDAEVIQINDKLRPYFWRTSKEDLGVPLADPDEFIEVSPSPEQIRLAEVIYMTVDNQLAAWIRMIQLSTNPELINQAIDYKDLGFSEEDEIDNDSYDQVSASVKNELAQSIHEATIADVGKWDLSKVSSPKFDEGIKLVENIVRKYGKVVVWGLFVKTLEKIVDTLNYRGINARLIYGGTDRYERDSIIDTFREETDEIQVLVSNPNTLGESVSLHDIAHDAIYFEYNYNLTFMLQSRDRIHRLGLKPDQHTRYYYLMTKSDREFYNFIDEEIYLRLKKKEERMKNAIDGDFLVPEFTDDEIELMKEIINNERKY